MGKQLPFTFTPSIVRYIRLVLETHERMSQGLMKHQSVPPFAISFVGYERGEYFMSHSELMRERFLDYLGDSINYDMDFVGPDALYDDKLTSPFVPVSPSLWEKGTFGPTVESFGITVKDIRIFRSLWDTYNSIKDKERPVPKGKVLFPSMEFIKETRLLSYRGLTHKFQTARDKRSPRFALFKVLWESRKHMIKNETVDGYPGTPLTLADLARFSKTKVSREDAYYLVNTLDIKGFPVDLEQTGEKLLLVVNET